MNPLHTKILIWLAGYGAFLVVLSLLVVQFVRHQTSFGKERLLARTWAWFGRWHLLVLLITLCGAVAGAFLYPLFGSLIGMDLSVGRMVRYGVFDGGFYALIWAPGISFVACLIWGKRRMSSNPGEAGKALDTGD